ncbi:MAG: branched-chain amino acid ABC transporter permease [Candidatus Nanopelagicales bacterium]
MNLELLAQLTVSGIVLGSFYALLGVSFGLIYQTSKIFHLANAIPFAAAAYGAVWSAGTLHLPLWAAVLFGLLMALVFGMLILVLGYFPIISRNGALLSLFLVSLGISVAFPNLLQIVFGTENIPLQTVGPDGELGSAFENSVFSAGFVTITLIDVLKVIVAWAVVLAVVLFVNRTRFGRSITALRTNPTMAAGVGINSKVVYIVVFGLGSIITGIAGVFVAAETVAYPTMAIQWTLVGFIAVFFGGIGSLTGTALGGLILGLLSQWSGLFFGVQFAPVVVFGALFVILLVRPQGLFGKAAV